MINNASARRATRILVGFAAVFALVLSAAFTSTASAEPAGSVAPDGWTVPLVSPATSVALGTNSTQVITGSVPDGLTPSSLNVQLQLAPGVKDGDVILQPTSHASPAAFPAPSVRIPFAAFTPGEKFPVAVPLSLADVENHRVTVAVSTELTPLRSVCIPPAQAPGVVVTDANMSLTGDAKPPETVADFLPATANTVTVYVPSSPSQTELAAALNAVAALAHRYPQSTFVSLTTLSRGTSAPPGAPFDPYFRSIMIVDGSAASTTVQRANSPYLLITGPPANLLAAASAMDAPQLPLAAAPLVGNTTATPASVDTKSLSIKAADFPDDVSGVGRLLLSANISQDQFGGPLGGLAVHFTGTATPVQKGAQATLSLLVNDRLVVSQALKNADRFTVNASVAPALLRRVNSVVLRADYTPVGGRCVIGAMPFQMSLDASSKFTATPGQSLAPGFERFPQVMADKVSVAFATSSDDTAIQAAALVASLARLQATTPHIDVVDLDSVKSSDSPAIVVGATPSTANDLGVPLKLQQFRVTTVVDGREVGFSVSSAFAALEAFENNSRDLVVLGAYKDPSLASRITDSIQNSPTGWSSLIGQVVISQHSGKPIVVPTADLAPQSSNLSNDSSKSPIPSWLLWLGFFIFVSIIARILFVRTRRARLRDRASKANKKLAAGQAPVAHSPVPPVASAVPAAPSKTATAPKPSAKPAKSVMPEEPTAPPRTKAAKAPKTKGPKKGKKGKKGKKTHTTHKKAASSTPVVPVEKQ